jgi:hypothetical protein
MQIRDSGFEDWGFRIRGSAIQDSRIGDSGFEDWGFRISD